MEGHSLQWKYMLLSLPPKDLTLLQEQVSEATKALDSRASIYYISMQVQPIRRMTNNTDRSSETSNLCGEYVYLLNQICQNWLFPSTQAEYEMVNLKRMLSVVRCANLTYSAALLYLNYHHPLNTDCFTMQIHSSDAVSSSKPTSISASSSGLRKVSRDLQALND
jgi:hypothetical protein